MLIGNPFYDPEDAPKPGAWEWDEKEGRRFRRVGNSIEWEMELFTAHAGKIPESMLSTYHKTQEESKLENEKTAKERALEAARARYCPFRIGNGDRCRADNCAFFDGDKCVLAYTKKDPARDTKGKLCPLARRMYTCSDRCALYRGGCSIAANMTESED